MHVACCLRIHREPAARSHTKKNNCVLSPEAAGASQPGECLCVCAHVRVPALRSYRWLKRSTRIPMRALPKGALGASQPGGQREEAQKRFGHD